MRYFSIEELTRSTTAEAKGIDNTPAPQVVANLTALVGNVLDRVREKWGRPITVNSGYRSPALNAAIGGSGTSQHKTGEAADISAGSKTDNERLYALIKQMRADGEIDYDQLIDEKGFTWLHVSYKRSGVNRGMDFKIV